MSLELIGNYPFIQEHEQEAVDILLKSLRKDNRIKEGFIYAGYEVHGYQIQECDCILYLSLKSPVFNQNYIINNLFFLIELKGHRNIEIKENDIFVYYNGKPHRILYPLRQRLHSLKSYIKEINKNINLFIYRGIFFSNISSNQFTSDKLSLLKPFRSYIFLKDEVTLDNLINMSINQRKPTPKNLTSFKTKNFDSTGKIKQVLLIAGEKMNPSEYERAKLEKITNRKIRLDRIPQYIQKLGQQFLYITGKAGTGKTLSLIYLAKTISSDFSLTSMIVTYNHALAADLKRLISILNQHGYLKEEIRIQTINHLVVQITKYFAPRKWNNISPLLRDDYGKGYKNCLDLLISTIKDDPETYKILLLEKFPELNVDFILVDEGQDWPEEEREIIKWLAGGYEKLIVAIGPDQITRGQRKYSKWFPDLQNDRKHFWALKENMRQKGKLYRFNKIISEELLHDEWTTSFIEERIGEGFIEIIPDSTLMNENFWLSLQKTLEASGNMPVDCLIIEPDELNKENNEKLTKEILSIHSLSYWDGTTKLIRQTSFPWQTSQYRIVKYSSCRGLEGWIVIVRLIDKQYSIYSKRFSREAISLLKEKIEDEVITQLRIALTRGIDGIYITYENEFHPFVQRLTKIKEKLEYQ